MNKKHANLLLQVRRLKGAGEVGKAVEKLQRAPAGVLSATPELALEYGECLMMLERFEEALKVYAKLAEKHPNSSVVFSNLGGALVRCRRMHEAKTVLEHALRLDPESLAARTNLGAVLQSLGDLSGALHNALELVATHPTEALAFNNLGSAFSDLNNLEAARHAFETAIILQPGQIDALTNLAVSESRCENYLRAIELYEQAILSVSPRAPERRRALEFFKSFDHLRLGHLKVGWELYDSGFSRLIPITAIRNPDRRFDRIARWQGEDLTGKTLLVWREQGLGDELRFAACIDDLEGLAQRIIFECSPRLAGVFKRAWPFVDVRAETDSVGQNIPVECDYEVPVGSLMRFFRKEISDFSRSRAYVSPKTELVDKFRERLKSIRADKKLVGICWRSGLLSPTRNSEYTHILDWKTLLTRDDVVFVNLQYGESAQELAEVRDRLGIEIVSWPDLNLKNDVEEVFALISCLDMVVTVRTTVNNMAGAVGTRCVLLIKQNHWSLLGQDVYPWFPRNETIRVPEAEAVASRLGDVHRLLDSI